MDRVEKLDYLHDQEMLPKSNDTFKESSRRDVVNASILGTVVATLAAM